VQARLPILVGGDGEKVTLRLVARYGDACNLSVVSGIAALSRKLAALRQHCREVGRVFSEIELTAEISVVVVRDSRAEALEVYRRIGGPLWMGEQPAQSVGTAHDLTELFQSLVDLGFSHVLCGFPSPYDEETMERLVREVLPCLTSHT
jgi:alkanesulfonate monooxygenase SsuD/methylene tetrahydromethanopterin reductase-like flavin-dependent oxidoreductase (luciferase family)